VEEFYPEYHNSFIRTIHMKISLQLIFSIILVTGFVSGYSQTTVGGISLPRADFQRVALEEGSFGEWLRGLPLKPAGSPVSDCRGRIYKSAQDTAVGAVIDMDIRGRRLEQCMDILVRLYADYLWQTDGADELVLPLPGGFWLSWTSWADGFRPQYRGIEVSLSKKIAADRSLTNFNRYLREIYANSHTLQFYYNYEPIEFDSVQPGDVIIKNGRKKHAVMIIDLARNRQGDLIGLIGHGDTPACQFFLLRYKNDSLWFPLDKNQEFLPLPIRRRMSWEGLRRFGEPKSRHQALGTGH
jgi:hypothetical protein